MPAAPRRLRDLYWAPAKLQTGPAFRGQNLGEVLLPALAPQTFQHPDDAVKLGRMSVWERDEQGVEAPYGLKLLLLDVAHIPAMVSLAVVVGVLGVAVAASVYRNTVSVALALACVVAAAGADVSRSPRTRG